MFSVVSPMEMARRFCELPRYYVTSQPNFAKSPFVFITFAG